MPKLIRDFGDGRQRTIETTAVMLAIELAVERLGNDALTCAAIGVSRNILARWRAGVVPRRVNLRALAEAAEIPVEWLL